MMLLFDGIEISGIFGVCKDALSGLHEILSSKYGLGTNIPT